jgi:hypothetical protein
MRNVGPGSVAARLVFPVPGVPQIVRIRGSGVAVRAPAKMDISVCSFSASLMD